jgi:DNA-binding response OmpR family regulator
MFARKILVVDDEETIRDTVCDFLNLKGYEARGVAQGKQALRLMESFVPNVVFLDYMMPIFSGLELFPRMKKIFPFLKVIIVTGRGSEEIAVRALKMGIDDYITKPFDLEAMRKSLDFYLEKQREEIIHLNHRYFYPIEDPVVSRYEYLRLVHSRPELGVKTASAFFTFSRQDFYNHLNRFRKMGLLGVLGEREIKDLSRRFGETRLKRVQLSGFTPFPFIERSANDGEYRLDRFLNWSDPAQVKLEMIRAAAVSRRPHVGEICRLYGITREAFYQNYRAFQAKGVFGLLSRKKGRPRKNQISAGA